MKKMITVILALIMVVTITACGKSEKNTDLCGTWSVDCIEYDGTKFSVEEWKISEGEDLSSLYVIFKDGGKAYVYEDGYGELVNWLKSEESVMIDGEICSIVDGSICLEYYGNKLYLKKSSDSQVIPQENEENTEFEEQEDDYEDVVETNDIFGMDGLEELEEQIVAYVEEEVTKLDEESEVLVSDVTTYEEYVAKFEKIAEYYEKVNKLSYDITVKLYEYSVSYAEIIMNSNCSLEDMYDAFEGVYDCIYDDAGEDLYDGIYDGILNDLYDVFYDGVLEEHPEGLDYSEWSNIRSKEYKQWAEARSNTYEHWADMRSDVYEFWSDMRGHLYDEDWERAQKEFADFKADVQKLKEN